MEVERSEQRGDARSRASEALCWLWFAGWGINFLFVVISYVAFYGRKDVLVGNCAASFWTFVIGFLMSQAVSNFAICLSRFSMIIKVLMSAGTLLLGVMTNAFFSMPHLNNWTGV